MIVSLRLVKRNFSISPGNRLSTGEQRPPLMSRRCLRRPLSRDPDAVIVGAVHRCSNAPPGVIENLPLATCIPCLTLVYVVCPAPVIASYHPGPNIRELPSRRYHAPHHYNSRGGAFLLPHRACSDPEPESQSAAGI